MSVRYEDPHISCDDEGITIRKYAFPLGEKRVRYEDIQRYHVHPMGPLTGKLRIWGGNLRYWFHLDSKRPWKDRAIVLDLGKRTLPVLTPDQLEPVLELLRERVGPPAE